MNLQDLTEGKRNDATKAVKIWLKIGDLMTDLQDELLDLAKNEETKAHATKALEFLQKDDLASLHLEMKKIFKQLLTLPTASVYFISSAYKYKRHTEFEQQINELQTC